MMCAPSYYSIEGFEEWYDTEKQSPKENAPQWFKDLVKKEDEERSKAHAEAFKNGIVL